MTPKELADEVQKILLKSPNRNKDVKDFCKSLDKDFQIFLNLLFKQEHLMKSIEQQNEFKRIRSEIKLHENKIEKLKKQLPPEKETPKK